MYLTPEEERRAQLRKDKVAQRRKKVQRMKLTITGGCALAVVLIVVFMTKDISGSNASSLSSASANTSMQITEAKETATQETIQETASELMETASSDSEEDGTQTRDEIPAAASLDSPYAQALVDLAKQEPRLITMLQNLSDYPEDLHKMVVENNGNSGLRTGLSLKKRIRSLLTPSEKSQREPSPYSSNGIPDGDTAPTATASSVPAAAAPPVSLW